MIRAVTAFLGPTLVLCLLAGTALADPLEPEPGPPDAPVLVEPGPPDAPILVPGPLEAPILVAPIPADVPVLAEPEAPGGMSNALGACAGDEVMCFAAEVDLVPAKTVITPPDPPNLAPPSAMSTDDAIKAILGLLVLFALAYIAGHPRVVRFEQRIGIARLVTAGVPFLLLGLIGRSQGVLSDPVLDAIRPLLPLGLGWIGFAVGFRFDVRIFDNFPRVMLQAFLMTTLLPFAMIVGAAAIMLALVEGITADAAFVRDALILATAGAITSRAVITMLAKRNTSPANIDRALRLIQLEELAAFVGLLLLGAFFRPETGGWLLPNVGWVFIAVGVGAVLGVLIFAALRTLKGPNETSAVMLGSICLAGGIAGSLRFSPLVVCFIAGALLVNLPGQWKEQVRSALLRIEQPVYLLFLVLAGAIWRVDQWEAWVLMIFFVAARLGGRYIGLRLFGRRHPDVLGPAEQQAFAASPMSALSMAIVVSAQVLYSGKTVPWIVHTIIVGGIVTEIVVHIFTNTPRFITGLLPAFLKPEPAAPTAPATTAESAFEPPSEPLSEPSPEPSPEPVAAPGASE